MVELFSISNLIDPTTFDILWTILVSSLMVLATTFTVALLPWTDQEIRATHQQTTRFLSNLQPRLLPSQQRQVS